MRDELDKLRTLATENKGQIHALREDNSRKTKLLGTLRAARAADVSALEQWRNEHKEMEENLKRWVLAARHRNFFFSYSIIYPLFFFTILIHFLSIFLHFLFNSYPILLIILSHRHRLQRALSSKDAIVKDLRARAEAAEEQQQLREKSDADMSASAPPGTSTSHPDLASLPAAELRNRYSTT